MKAVLQTRLKQQQQLTLTPQLQQAIRLLQLSAQELSQEIQKGLEENPMLELHEESEQHPVKATESTNNTPSEEEMLFSQRWQESFISNRRKPADDFSQNEIKDTKSNSLEAYLLWQMRLTPFTETDQAIAIAIIDSIDDDGFLTCSLDDIHACFGFGMDEIEIDEIEAVLQRIQQFDPVGVGARNLQEYLLIQLKALKETDEDLKTAIKNAKTIINNHIDLLAKHDYRSLKQSSHLRENELAAAIRIIQTLHSRPSQDMFMQQPDYVTPDVVVIKKNGEWIIQLNKEVMPRIQVNQTYANLLGKIGEKQSHQQLREHLQEARWLIKSLESRNDTLVRVASCIVAHQQAFFEHGDDAMKPLILQDIATATDLHESTISRITTRKYLQTPRGLYELKYFFSSHLQTNSGHECSSTSIRAKIKTLIGEESAAKPLSDNKIALQLKEEYGINIARRTVTKYREAMTIRPSNERKQMQQLVEH